MATRNAEEIKAQRQHESPDQFVAELARIAEKEAAKVSRVAKENGIKENGIEEWQARKWLRALNSVDMFAAEVAELMGKDHNDATAQWAQHEALSVLGDITRIVTGGPEGQLAMMYYQLRLARESVVCRDFESAIQGLASAGQYLPFLLGQVAADKRGAVARRAADKLHDKPGGSREKAKDIREIWATGNYRTREECAEQVHESLKMSFSAARKALRNTPEPKRGA